jgi:hypothetical protein
MKHHLCLLFIFFELQMIVNTHRSCHTFYIKVITLEIPTPMAYRAGFDPEDIAPLFEKA